MDTGALVSMIIMWLVFIGGLGFCFSRLGKGGWWGD